MSKNLRFGYSSLKTRYTQFTIRGYFLNTSTAKTASVSAIKRAFHERERWLYFHNAELRYAAPLFYPDIAGRVHGHLPPVVRTAIARIDHAHRICLQNAEVLERRTTRSDMRLITFRQLHRNPQVNQAELARLECHGLCRGKVNPVGLSADISKALDGIVEVLNFNGLCSHAVNIKRVYTQKENPRCNRGLRCFQSVTVSRACGPGDRRGASVRTKCSSAA